MHTPFCMPIGGVVPTVVLPMNQTVIGPGIPGNGVTQNIVRRFTRGEEVFFSNCVTYNNAANVGATVGIIAHRVGGGDIYFAIAPGLTRAIFPDDVSGFSFALEATTDEGFIALWGNSDVPTDIQPPAVAGSSEGV